MPKSLMLAMDKKLESLRCSYLSFCRKNTSIPEPIAFYAVLTSYDTIPVGSTVEFNDILLNQGNGLVHLRLPLIYNFQEKCIEQT